MDDDSSEKAISIAICAWNMSSLLKEKQEKAMQDIYAVLSESNNDEYLETLRQIVDMLMERKRMHYHDNKKLIVDYQFSISRNKRRLYVVSTQSP